jgi:predicted dehydrogenase
VTTSLAVQGAGLIGRRHIEFIQASPEATLSAIIDPAPESQAIAEVAGCPWFPDFATMLAAHRPDGIIVATPTQMHVEHGLACIRAGIPVLVEKPIAGDLEGATRLVEAAETAGVPLLVGHHRRHNALVQRAQKAIEAGEIGEIVAVHGICWFAKPDSYFAPEWRRAKGAGPVFTNLIHDIDLLRALCGDVTAVQAMESNHLRGNEIEETVTILLRFKTGVLGTITVSDKIAAPWSWEFTAGENPDYSQTQESCYQIGGTQGSLSLPQLDIWSHGPTPDWWTPITPRRLTYEASAPLANQIQNFCAVIAGTETPVVSGREGLATLAVIVAIKQAAETGTLVRLGER